jgi:hypothetical protein
LTDKSPPHSWQSQLFEGGKEEEQPENLFELLKGNRSFRPLFERGEEEERLEHHAGRFGSLRDRRSNYDKDDEIIQAFQRYVHQLRQSRDQAIYVNPDNPKAEGSWGSKAADKENTRVSVASIQRNDPTQKFPKKVTFDEWVSTSNCV